MASYLILGAGKFGRLALERLTRLDGAARFLVVDRSAASLAAARDLAPHQGEWVEAEAGAFLAGRLENGASWDWLIPMVPEHVAYAWLRRNRLAPPDWVDLAVPGELAALAPTAVRGREGGLYLSRASHLCPDDCPEPEVCPVTGEDRMTPLFAKLAGFQAPGFKVAVIPSRPLAPGVGGYPPGLLPAAARELASFPGKVLIITACRCHGVAHALARQRGRK
jgi:hypothetical protein